MYGIIHITPKGKRIGQLPMYDSFKKALEIAKERKAKNPGHHYIVKEVKGEML